MSKLSMKATECVGTLQRDWQMRYNIVRSLSRVASIFNRATVWLRLPRYGAQRKPLKSSSSPQFAGLRNGGLSPRRRGSKSEASCTEDSTGTIASEARKGYDLLVIGIE